MISSPADWVVIGSNCGEFMNDPERLKACLNAYCDVSAFPIMAVVKSVQAFRRQNALEEFLLRSKIPVGWLTIEPNARLLLGR